MNKSTAKTEMNVFEELIAELKTENLLEGIGNDLPGRNGRPSASALGPFKDNRRLDADSFELDRADPSSGHGVADFASETTTGGDDSGNFYRRRAVDEVAGLQMVDHIISAIEREYMKIVPSGFTDLHVKKALHDFLKFTDEPHSNERLESEGLLIHATEEWCSALSERDSNISVTNIRRFCENSRPALSSQALMALARFYRISPFSEPVRGKFDFVITRLFTRDAGTERRMQLFGMTEMVGHIRDLYENWASIALFDTVSDVTELSARLMEFQKFIAEADAAECFDSLIKSNFFNRIRTFKEDISEMFFIPELTGAAIECNVRVGNRFVELLEIESAKLSAEIFGEKYGYTYDTVISGAASKTLNLIEIIKEVPELNCDSPAEHPLEGAVQPRLRESEAARPAALSGRESGFFSVNRWLLAFTLIIIAACAGVYMWADKYSAESSAPVTAANVSLENTGLSEHIKIARSSSGTFYGVVDPTWDAMSVDVRKQVLMKSKSFAESKGLNKVNLLNGKGRTIAFSDGAKAEIVSQ